jgi:2-amino-4-hydroxy-6-hydroxymethyldihydropteridine diphosphokinase
MKTPEIAYLSLGSNLGDRAGNLHDAIERLKDLGAVIAQSSLYETEPVEVGPQPWFLNCSAALATDFAPESLLKGILAVEQSMGRRRATGKEPRTIDIDILFMGRLVVDSPMLTLPHPAIQNRRFVLAPLAEIAPNLMHPVLQKTITQLLNSLPPDYGMVRKFQAA